MKKNKKLWLILLAVSAGLASLAIYAACNYNLRAHNFAVVEEGKLYRSSEPDEEFLKEMVSRRHIKTIIVLTRKVRDFEKRIASENSITIVHFPLKTDREPNNDVVSKFLEIIRDPKAQPVLVHCRAGADRTGMLVAIKRVEVDGWPPEKALEEMEYYRHLPIFHPVINGYLKKRFDAKQKNLP